MHATQLDPDLEAQLRSVDLTYNAVGRTSGVLPDGYHHLNRGIIIGFGTTLFVDASRALFGWQMHLRSGLSIATSSATARHDAVVMLGIGAGRLRVSAPCRVVYIVDEPNRKGFAYGTLPGHPESGEEAFMIEHSDDDSVSLGITAFSSPASQLAKFAGPLGRLAQRRMTGRYLRSLTAEAQQRG